MKTIALGEVAYIDRNTIDAEAIEDETLYVGLEHITSDGNFEGVSSVSNGELNSTKFKFHEGHILYGKLRPYLKKIALPSFQGICSTDILPIKPKANIDKRFLFYCLRQPSMIELATAQSTGANLPRLSPSRLLEFPIPLPPLAEQKRIARILDVAAALQAQRRATLTHLDTLLQSTFLHMFGDPVTNPMHWETKKLSDCIVGSANNGFFAKNDKYEDEGTPVIWIGDFLDQFYSQTIGLKRVKATAKDIAKNRVEYGDVLFCRSSLTPAGIGKASIIPQNLKEETIFECHIIRCTLNQAMLIPEYFRVYSDTRYFRSQIVKNSKTATMTTISQQGVTETIVLVPPLELQKRFTKMARRILERQTILEQNAEKLGDLFASLQQRAFRGELSPSP